MAMNGTIVAAEPITCSRVASHRIVRAGRVSSARAWEAARRSSSGETVGSCPFGVRTFVVGEAPSGWCRSVKVSPSC
jgi:hypothetical protein